MKEIFCDVEVLQSFDQIKQTLVLKEEENNQFITVSGIPLDSIFIKLDVNKTEYKQKSKYLRKGVSFIHKGCDYCLIIPSKEIILLFELKSLKPKVKDYVDQFVASEIFINYCRELYKYKNKIREEFSFRRILLSTKYNYLLTSKGVIDISKEDIFGNKINIVTPGFPNAIRLEKLLN